MKRQADENASENIRKRLLSVESGHKALSLFEIKELSEAFEIIDDHGIRLSANEDDEMIFVFPISANPGLVEEWWQETYDDKFGDDENAENATIETDNEFRSRFGVSKEDVKYILVTAEVSTELYRDMGNLVLEFYPQDTYEFSDSEDVSNNSTNYLFKRTIFTGLIKAYYKRQ